MLWNNVALTYLLETKQIYSIQISDVLISKQTL